MREGNRRRVRVLGVLLVLLMPLVAGWPAAARGQGPGLSEEMVRFLEQRMREPDQLPLLPGAAATRTSGPQGLRVWQIEQVDAPAAGCSFASMALDSVGHPHFSYYETAHNDGNLKYAHNDGAGWQVQTVDSLGDVGASASLALDAGDRPHIAYLDYTNGAVKYARFDGALWRIETVVPGGLQGGETVLALDPLGRPHIGYYTPYPDFDLRHAYYDGTSWHIETVDTAGLIEEISLAVDAAGHPHFLYRDWGSEIVRYACHDGTAWHTETLPTPSQCCGTALLLDGQGMPHVSFLGSYDLRYGWYDGSSWHLEVVTGATSPSRPSLALDAAGRPHISYIDSYKHDVRYAWYDGSAWSVARVDLANMYSSYDKDANSIAMDSKGTPHIGYVGAATGGGYAIKYAVYATNVADWSKLAFASYRDMNWEIYSARGDGANEARLTFNNATDRRPDVNHQGSQVVFESLLPGNYDIYRVNVDGGGLVRLTANSFGEYRPRWSPDGSKIVYYGYPDDPNNGEIYVMNADGSGQTRLTWDPAWNGHPAWSPDGSKIAYVSQDAYGSYHIWTMNADGTQQQQLGTLGWTYMAFPDWSPDGARIVVNTDIHGDGWIDLAVVAIADNGMNPTFPLGDSPAYYDYYTPIWSPTGTDLIFAKIQWTTCPPPYYWCWVDAYITGVDLSTGSSYLLTDSGMDWYPSWKSTDMLAPASQVAALPAWSGASFAVSWSGSDAGGAGLESYDVQYRDGAGGTWTDWLLDTTETAAQFTGAEDHTYYFRCRARDYAYNLEPYPEEADAWTTVDATPPASAASSPDYAAGPTFVVTWAGSDSGSGIASYDVQVRDGTGPWSDWVLSTTATEAAYAGHLGHAYYFQSRARDNAGNQEAYPGGNGDSHTHTPPYSLTGYVLDNRDDPVAVAQVEASPPMSNTAYSRGDGAFTFYFHLTGTYDLQVDRGGFGALPPMKGVAAPGAVPTFYLPPLDDRIADGGFEAGDLAAWGPSGDVVPTLTVSAHTGDCAAAVGGSAPAPLVTPTMPFSASAAFTAAGGLLSSTLAVVEVPAGAVSGTVLITLTGVPTVTALPTGTQDIGLHVALSAALTDGTPLTTTVLPMSITLLYSDVSWQAAQVAGEGTLGLWRYDAISRTWQPLDTVLDPVSNTAAVTTTQPGLLALLGQPYAGPWVGILEQEAVLTPTLDSGTLSLLYHVLAAQPPSDTLRVWLVGPTTTVTYTLPLTVSGWVHEWWDVPSWAGPTLTLRLEWRQAEREHLPAVVLDEVSLGPVVVGAYAIYLPLVVR